jgi:hypothetical protein
MVVFLSFFTGGKTNTGTAGMRPAIGNKSRMHNSTTALA